MPDDSETMVDQWDDLVFSMQTQSSVFSTSPPVFPIITEGVNNTWLPYIVPSTPADSSQADKAFVFGRENRVVRILPPTVNFSSWQPSVTLKLIYTKISSTKKVREIV